MHGSGWGERTYLSARKMTVPSQTRRSHPSLLAVVEDSPGYILIKLEQVAEKFSIRISSQESAE